MNKITPFFHPRQAENRRKNKKGHITRKRGQSNVYLQLLSKAKPENISHKQGFDIRSLLSTFTVKNIKVTRVLFREIVRSANKLSHVSRGYLKKAAGYKDEKVISMLVGKLEEMGILEVDQYIKKVNTYSFGPLLKDKIVVSYLVQYIPSLRRILPALFSLSILLSSSAHSEGNATQHRENIYIKKEDIKKNNKTMKNEAYKVNLFERDFVQREYNPPQKTVLSKYISCCAFKRMKNGERIAYFRKFIIAHKDSNNGLIPVDETMQNMLLCEKSGCDKKTSM